MWSERIGCIKRSVIQGIVIKPLFLGTCHWGIKPKGLNSSTGFSVWDACLIAGSPVIWTYPIVIRIVECFLTTFRSAQSDRESGPPRSICSQLHGLWMWSRYLAVLNSAYAHSLLSRNNYRRAVALRVEEKHIASVCPIVKGWTEVNSAEVAWIAESLFADRCIRSDIWRKA